MFCRVGKWAVLGLVGARLVVAVVDVAAMRVDR
jgi:hypothetical protein